jgi:hypothetical protein
VPVHKLGLSLLVRRDIQGAAVPNALVTLAKTVPLLLFIARVAMAFTVETFSLNFWGRPASARCLIRSRAPCW